MCPLSPDVRIFSDGRIPNAQKYFFVDSYQHSIHQIVLKSFFSAIVSVCFSCQRSYSSRRTHRAIVAVIVAIPIVGATSIVVPVAHMAEGPWGMGEGRGCIGGTF